MKKLIAVLTRKAAITRIGGLAQGARHTGKGESGRRSWPPLCQEPGRARTGEGTNRVVFGGDIAKYDGRTGAPQT